MQTQAGWQRSLASEAQRKTLIRCRRSRSTSSGLCTVLGDRSTIAGCGSVTCDSRRERKGHQPLSDLMAIPRCCAARSHESLAICLDANLPEVLAGEVGHTGFVAGPRVSTTSVTRNSA